MVSYAGIWSRGAASDRRDPHLPEHTLLAIDAGQTGIKTRLVTADGTAQEWLFPGVLTDRPLLSQLTTVVAEVTRVIGQAPHTVTFGVSGLTSADDEADALMQHPDVADVQRIAVTHDSVTSFLGVLGDQQGAVVAAGTGVVVLPMSVARLHARKDVVHRVVTDLPTTTVALVWRMERDDELTQEFVGVVRGRTARSSR